ncbi:acyl-CoA carboxylase epsilon subunit [Streptomyces sp. NPDC005551]|uniref:acyl-CoA carboxylase epsilon subunit n=1 Tax=unclassified Streptomyces TaxID=2593676 RepID=UPI0034097871
MSDADAVGPVVRVVRGAAGEEELAAVAVVLGALLAGRGAQDGLARQPRVADWRPAGGRSVFRSPHSWQ